MKKRSILFSLSLVFILAVVFLSACSKGGGSATPPDPCAGVTISVTASAADADPGTANGSITASATGSSSFTFSINNGALQSSGTFANVAAGTYTVTAKNANGCTGSASITVKQKDLCAGKTITVAPSVTQNSDPCSPNGIVVITATGSTGFSFNIDNGAFQAATTFNAVSAGSHDFGAKDAGGCLKTVTVNVPAVAAGPAFTAVKNLLQATCAVAGCHNGTQAPNYTIDCNIVAFADLIKTRAVDQAGTAQQMPQPPRAALNQADKDKITAWINAGKRFTD
jgi:hypothetical protein